MDHILDWLMTVIIVIIAIFVIIRLPYILGWLADRFGLPTGESGKILDPEIQKQLEKDKVEKQLKEHKGLERNLSRNSWNY